MLSLLKMYLVYYLNITSFCILLGYLVIVGNSLMHSIEEKSKRYSTLHDMYEIILCKSITCFIEIL